MSCVVRTLGSVACASDINGGRLWAQRNIVIGKAKCGNLSKTMTTANQFLFSSAGARGAPAVVVV